jgi:hypothetical protein
MTNVSIVAGTMWKCSGTVVQLNAYCFTVLITVESKEPKIYVRKIYYMTGSHTINSLPHTDLHIDKMQK